MNPDLSYSLSEHDCIKVFEALQADFSWQWDSRFETTLAQIRSEEKDAVGRTLGNLMGTAWNSSTIAKAPESLQPVLARLGGIMSDQLLYAAALPRDGIVFCAWWPWGNGQTISIRIGTDPNGSALLATLVPPDAR